MASTLTNAELPQHQRGDVAVPSVVSLVAKAGRCAAMSRDLGAGVASISPSDLTADQRVGLARAFDDVHAALARAAAVVGHAPVAAPVPAPRPDHTSGFAHVVEGG